MAASTALQSLLAPHLDTYVCPIPFVTFDRAVVAFNLRRCAQGLKGSESGPDPGALVCLMR
jgi:hypothetical protein